MKAFKISPRVREKLTAPDHAVTMDEIVECFMNMEGPAFQDDRADHVTDPPTQWFVAETDRRRVLKIVYVEYPDFFAIKSAYQATQKWVNLYAEMCAQHTP